MSTANALPPAFAIDANIERQLSQNAFERVVRPLLVLDDALIVRMANAEFVRAIGARREDVIGRPLSELGGNQWALAQLPGHLMGVLRNRQPFTRLELSGAFGGAQCTLLVAAQELDPIVPDVRMLLVGLEDISERRRMENHLAWYTTEVERSNRDLESYAVVASHDLQEPLRKIRAYGDILATEHAAALPSEARSYVTRMVDAGARMQGLINDLLALARITTAPARLAPVQLDELARLVLLDTEIAMSEAHATVHLGALPTIEGDALQLRQLLQNLVSNALKFRGAAQPTVRLYAEVVPTPALPGAEDAAPWHAIHVTDNGIGFEQRHAENIFRPFQRLHGREAYPGTGMGLAICRKICERHFGFITVRSAPGEGTTFTITLPSRAPVSVGRTA
jgi:signal transduction histidine kinase